MEPIEILNHFCIQATGDRFAAPWSFGEYSYATNRAALVRVPICSGVPFAFFEETGIADQALSAPAGSWYRLPKIERKYRQCPYFNEKNCPDTNCMECDETGRIRINTGYRIGGALFTAVMLEFISVLPDVEISPDGPDQPARIRFAGGVGLVMPSLR